MKKLLVALSFALVLILGIAVSESSAASSTVTTVYTVKSGDNLYKISKAYGVSVSNIKSWNNLKSNALYRNQKLKITYKKATNKTPSRSASTAAAKKEFTVSATAYTAFCKGCSGITKTGINLKKNPSIKVIAVDPKVIKLGSKVYVEGYGYAVAGDTGGAIKGNKIDVFIASQSQALKWGRKNVKVKVF